MSKRSVPMPKLAILAGGLATRLGHIARDVPKALVPVNGEPFLAHQLRLAMRQGFCEVVLLVGHYGEQIEKFAGDGTAFGVNIKYSYDGLLKRGTGGAIINALGDLGDRFFVLYGDSYLDIDVVPIWEFYLNQKYTGLMTVLHNENRHEPSNVVFDGTKVLLHDKLRAGRPGVEWIDYGLSVFNADCFGSLPQNQFCELSLVTRDMAREGKLLGYEVRKRFYEIGNPGSLLETEAYLRSKAVT